jgi:peptidoglycan hydrolase-like protein with peptidoglycan-binding domain
MRHRIVLVGLLLVAACTGQDGELRAREAEQKIRESIPDVVGRALDQKVTPEQVKGAQQALTVVHEYMGEVNGVLDAVTVNAIQAFQRAQGLQADGLLTARTERRLQEAAAQASTPTS